MEEKKHTATISLDLDNKWAYMRSSNISGWDEFPSYLDLAVPRSLDVMEQYGLKITYFIVGQDAALEKNHNALAQIVSAGHEIGNHSFNHEPWLHLYTKQELIDDVEEAESAIERATGYKPRGFRAPGFSLSPTVLEVLVERGYDYDCSTFPTYIGPLARAFYFLKSEKMSESEKAKRMQLFGKISDGLQTLHPHIIEINGKRIVEIPVTTLPIFKVPVHVSYLMYLASFSKFLAKRYWQTAMTFCKISGTSLSLLLHPLDFLGGDDVAELKFFPGMAMHANEKIELLHWIISSLDKRTKILTMKEQADIVAAQ